MLAPLALNPQQESRRLQALHDLDVLDTPAESLFDDLVLLASEACKKPIALISLVDARRQWFKAHCGMASRETPRAWAFCAHALDRSTILEIPDALADPRFAQSPLVSGAPHIRFYAGAPLIGQGGLVYGTLCVIDQKPATLSTGQRGALERLARQAVVLLEARRDRLAAEAKVQTLAHLLDAVPDGILSCGPDGKLREFNHAARFWHGVDASKIPVDTWPEYFELHAIDGTNLIPGHNTPLARARRGEAVREAELVILARGQPPRVVLCNADALHDAQGRLLGAVCTMRDVTSLRDATHEALLAARRFTGAFASAAHGMAMVSLAGSWLEVNDALCQILGYSAEELQQLDFQRLTHPDDLSSDLDLVDDLLQGRRNSYQMAKRYFRKDGRIVWARLAVSLVRDEASNPMYFVSQIQDVSEQHAVEQRLRESEAQMRTVADHVPALIAHIDVNLTYRFANKAYATWFGRQANEIVGQHMSEVLTPEHFQTLQPYLVRVLSGEAVDFELEAIGPDGRLHIMRASYVPDVSSSDPLDRHSPLSFHLMISDVTADKELERMLEARALRDELTGLPNRTAWNDALLRSTDHARRHNGPGIAVMFLDLDDFKTVNDQFGHDVGDGLLCAFAERLKQALGDDDFVARLGGDEFVVLIDKGAQLAPEVERAAKRIQSMCAVAFQVNGHALSLKPSIGVAVQQVPGYDPALLMRHADEAMYRAKRAGGGSIDIVQI
ncbi:PAS domain S-box protein [Dyella sp.]|uniref:sensor domain-containing diguanylate cyclase n=1 Tax=Dyella sp. TaxID=1869338 RepID=UPI002ED51ED0